ncbi:prepilin-type N-terminal cleavage/methylation domain-containing protein [Vibrio lentus]|uniref:MSHA biogenesis protein MshC n=1 Tax=Vibrio lentus TaxID=136468 RepID=A0A2N7C5G0_9VIBR|nr:prepilin-type N-terminal cleavage/methylation domain-containing protein [Vibrio lentus]PME47350.1 MSHA biogenesis protein MshC [Vibrio lentus]PME70741.1 MSHA biogenesis protein MshC [Vibrio lentus]PME85916.1 MSHA biogenesis protein MshC [Vibrio lentus]PMG76177.1 MSHA biogenesis protein MshC [Vibrio lentus]PMH92843.1 MSHA biogenesis protein MshC [Vibrio lentus]
MDNSPTPKGFTLVELIIVIIILGIVSTFAASRFVGTSSFSTFTAQEQIISVIRQVQVNRMQTNIINLYRYCNDTSNPELQKLCLRSRITINASCIGSSSGCSASDSRSRSDSVVADQVSFRTTPSVSQITFDLLGNPLDIASSGVSILITSGQSQASICINSQGYVREGACL